MRQQKIIFKSSGSYSLLKAEIRDRLKKARIELGFKTAKDFAENKGIKTSTYTLHEAGTRSMSFEVIELYSTFLKITPTWLLTGLGSKSFSRTRSVPIIDWDEILNYPKNVSTVNKKCIVSDMDLGLNSFSLALNDDSMAPYFTDGTIIIIDCSIIPKHKDLGLVLIDKKNGPRIRKIVQIEGQLYAKPLNPFYKSTRLLKDSRILGKVVQANLPL